MPVIRAQVSMPYVSGIPEDVSTNTFHFFTLQDPYEDPQDLAMAVAAFYNNGTIGETVAAFLHPVIDRTALACSIKIYDLSDPEPREPIYIHPWTLTSAADPARWAPLEVALCMSFKADPVSGVPPASLRNRVYLGPLSPEAFDEDGNGWPVPSDTFIGGIHTAGRNLLLASGYSGTWSVYSATRAAGALSSHFPVVEGWIDNEWDTQRRRGREATVRDTFDAAG